jgi:hypothetical protein
VSFFRKREFFDSTNKKYLLIHKVTYDGDKINAAISKGKEALILLSTILSMTTKDNKLRGFLDV